MRKRAIAIALAAMTAGCGGKDAANGKVHQAARAPTVVVTEVRTATVPVVREFVARTEAKETVAIQARVEAILESMHFEEGLPVKKGQVLYELDKRTYLSDLSAAEAAQARAEADLKLAQEQVSVRAAEAALVQAKASLKKAEQDVARLRPLAEQDAVPKQDLDSALAAEEVARAEVAAQEANLTNSKIREEVGVLQAKAQLQGAVASVELAKLDLGYCTITCPIDGLIGRTEVSVGNLVGRGEATQLATVSTIDPIYVTFAISEAEYLRLDARTRARGPNAKRPPVALILADDSVYGHDGRVLTAERAVAVETGTLQLVVEFPNPDGKLRPGQFGRVRIAVAQLENALLVPQRSIMEQQGAKIVFVVMPDNKVALRSVQVTERHEEFFVVTGGVKAGEKVIVEGQLKARPGLPVNPTDKPISREPGEKQD